MKNRQHIDLRGQLTPPTWVDIAEIAAEPSLNRMAEASLHYLNHNPDPARRWECRFAMWPTAIPYHKPMFAPNKYAYDAVSLGDTDLRMQMIWAEMRRMAGVGDSSEAEDGVLARVEDYIAGDGGVYINPAASTGCPVDDVWLSSWATGLYVGTMCNMHRLTGDKAALRRARHALDAVLKLTVTRDGMRDFPYNTPWRDGEWLSLGWAGEHMYNYSNIIEPLLRYYEESGDADALRTAKAFAEAYIESMIDTRGALEIDLETGAFAGHVHTHTRNALLGAAHLGALTGDSRYINWAEQIYDFVRSLSPGFGWYPETVPSYGYSETCVTGDMLGAAYWLARCGRLDAYEEMERTWRNYLRVTQFRVTPDIEAMVRSANPTRTGDELRRALEDLKNLEGGFIAQTSWNDLRQNVGGQTDREPDKALYMMGCCPPSAMLGLVYLRDAAVTTVDGCLCVNMTITADVPEAELRSDYASADKLTVRVRRAGTWLLRPPAWVDGDAVTVTRNGKAVPSLWDGPQCRYLRVDGAEVGDTLTLRYPLARFSQTLDETDAMHGTATYRFEWLGNRVLGVSPDGTHAGLFDPQRGI